MPEHDQRRSDHDQHLVLRHVRRKEDAAESVERRHERDHEGGPAADEREGLPYPDAVIAPRAVPQPHQSRHVDHAHDHERRHGPRLPGPPRHDLSPSRIMATALGEGRAGEEDSAEEHRQPAAESGGGRRRCSPARAGWQPATGRLAAGAPLVNCIFSRRTRPVHKAGQQSVCVGRKGQDVDVMRALSAEGRAQGFADARAPRSEQPQLSSPQRVICQLCPLFGNFLACTF